MYHVTAIRNGSIYGHASTYCDESGCSGHEMYLIDLRDVEKLKAFFTDSGDDDMYELCEFVLNPDEGYYDIQDRYAAAAEIVLEVEHAKRHGEIF